MDHSIENIWKQGFLRSDDLIAPRINDLYNQKSKNMADKLERMFKMNLLIILIVAFALFVALSLWGKFYSGVLLFLLFLGIVIFGKKELDRLGNIDKGVSSYNYLKAVDQWLQDVIAIYTNIYRVVYPAFFLVFVGVIWQTDLGALLTHKLLDHYPGVYMIYDVPFVFIIGVILASGFIGFVAGPIYKLDLKLVYGREFQKLDELISDMETLRG